MRKLFSLFIALLILLSLCIIPTYAEDELFSDEVVEYYANLGLQGTVLNVYNWGEYIDDEEIDVVSAFERLTGCDVNYTTFESNENMYSKLSGGGVSYDVIIPSDYMMERLMEEDRLEKLDYSNIPNYEKYFDEERYGYLVNDGLKDYGVIYNVGTTILIYNTKYIKERPTSWTVMWDEQYAGKVLMFNNPRDSFAIAQAILGQDFNTIEKEDWDAAAELLTQQRQKVSPKYVMDEVFNDMESGDYALAAYYAGDYELMAENNPDLDFVLPEEGVNTFFDAMCIPQGTQNKRGAEAFINFMMEPEIALANAEYIYYATPNKAVLENEDYSLIGSEAVYPSEEPVAQEFHNLPNDTLQYMNTLWMKVKGENNTAGLYIAFFVAIAVIILVIAVSILKKKRMKRYYEI
ncbi:MAG: spermidine/putrescine ABC transporter substrate-binding protein [Oscillospiraceae bacterium]|nr:spermidine/putrescine ABC transporter substrate-binding protein [Oscillospiraceae bacterium]